MLTVPQRNVHTLAWILSNTWLTWLSYIIKNRGATHVVHASLRMYPVGVPPQIYRLQSTALIKHATCVKSVVRGYREAGGRDREREKLPRSREEARRPAATSPRAQHKRTASPERPVLEYGAHVRLSLQALSFY